MVTAAGENAIPGTDDLSTLGAALIRASSRGQ
jgi:hypothetical protein